MNVAAGVRKSGRGHLARGKRVGTPVGSDGQDARRH
jgi:hypothetical protein